MEKHSKIVQPKLCLENDSSVVALEGKCIHLLLRFQNCNGYEAKEKNHINISKLTRTWIQRLNDVSAVRRTSSLIPMSEHLALNCWSAITCGTLLSMYVYAETKQSSTTRTLHLNRSQSHNEWNFIPFCRIHLSRSLSTFSTLSAFSCCRSLLSSVYFRFGFQH